MSSSDEEAADCEVDEKDDASDRYSESHRTRSHLILASSNDVAEFDVNAARIWIESSQTEEERAQTLIRRAAFEKYLKNKKNARRY